MQLRDVVLRRAVLLFLPLSAISLWSMPAYCEQGDGSVYVMTNAASGNALMVFDREEDGKLTRTEDVWTGGKGSGGTKDPLGSQGALAITSCGRRLIGVNAGSNSVSVFGIGRHSVWLEHVSNSGGIFPTSVTTRGDRVYVLNAGGTPNVAGFWITGGGELKPIPGGKHALPGGSAAGPAEVSLDPDGDALIVTEKNTNMIDIFGLKEDGAIKNVVSVPASGVTPFGFNFGRRGSLLVSEAAGGAVDGSTISSYWVEDDEATPELHPVTKSLPIGQTAACWVAVTPNGRFAFTTNTASETIGSFRVANDGALTLINKAAATVMAGSIPTDMGVTQNGKYLYAIGAVTNSLFVFRIDDGHLTAVETQAGIPASAQGIVAR